MRLVTFFSFISFPLFAVTGGAGIPKNPDSINLNTTPVGVVYSGSNNTALSTAAGVSGVAIVNGSSLGSMGIAFPLGDNTCTKSGLSNQEFTVPAGVGLVIDGKQVSMNKIICIRSKSLGSSLTSGIIDITVW